MSGVRKSAFTLIEVLASMAVLAILVLALVRVFGQATKAFERANTTAVRSASARAVMEILARDMEGMVVDRRAAFFKNANAFNHDFDDIYFITTSSSPEFSDIDSTSIKGRAVQLVNYYTTSQTNRYERYRLMRRTASMGEALAKGVDPYKPEDKEWWRKANQIGWNEVVVAENIVRFDVWVCRDNNDNVGAGNENMFNSNLSLLPYVSDQPPGYVDIYIQVASDDAMKKASELFKGERVTGDASLKNQAFRLLYQDSTALLTRIVPYARSGETLHPLPY